ncbi:hypothetical protein LTR99_007128 [Exophiala xenobiotica]|uniref:Uncharacterized protein n=1 Tax=Vermiconidia calcicola TaxID=1690605 RepID=A0AAV9PTN0_9PEZI|nr:hypothetical protein LTR96_005390 [Exophiala xenobiotica]KAK5300379.1 hypothetical protein LTR99_007128 [Exophiala xenobiotica]KAK5427509.1 hypothetical protein LTR34_008997 [Exophiala xenobiotica]KAK5528920.1 hypothetical protein LTR25_010105 [Vermiconidia calcicola]
MWSPTASISLLLGLIALTLSQSVEYSTDASGNVYASTVYDSTSGAASSSSDGITSTASAAAYTSSTTFSSSYTTGSTYIGATTTPSTTSTSLPAIQTVPYTGQALLVGTCGIAQFTIITFPDGGSLEVPLVGCSDDRPECCPSLNFTESTPSQTGDAEASESSGTASASESGEGEHASETTSWTGTTPSPTPTGVVSMLSKAPLTVCPSDMVDLDPVCCPIGFSHYGQSIIGNLPCVSTLTTTVYSPDPSVLSSITSVISASMVAASTTSTPTVSVIINQVFALGLPCADNAEEDQGNHTHLSTGAKAGIGAGVGLAALFVILGLWACLAVRHRRRKKMRALEAAANAAGGPVRPGASGPETGGAYAAAAGLGGGGNEAKHMSMATTITGPPGSPGMQQQSPLMGGFGQPHGYGPAFGYVQPQQHQGMMQMPQDMYGGAYGMGVQHPGGGGFYSPPMSQSPPPPPGYGYYAGQNKDGGHGVVMMPPAEVDGGQVAPHRVSAGPPQGMGMSGSDTRSQGTESVTAVNSGHSEAAELSDNTYSHSAAGVK